MTIDRDRLALAAFAGTSALAGGNAVAIRFGNRELEPLATTSSPAASAP